MIYLRPKSAAETCRNHSKNGEGENRETWNLQSPNKNIQIALADGIPTSFANDLWQVDVQYLGAIQGLLSKTAAPEAKGAQRIWVWFKHIDLHLLMVKYI